MARIRALFTTAPLLGVVGACTAIAGLDDLVVSYTGGGGSGGAPSATSTKSAGAGCGPAVQDGCAEYASAVCNRRASCEPFQMTIEVGDSLACQEAVKLQCTRWIETPDGGVDATMLGACAAELATLDCARYVERDWPPSCFSAGTRAEGDTCGTPGQCAPGLRCSAPVLQSCGNCQPAPPVGAPCTSACAPGGSCIGSVCVASGQVGAACGGAGMAPCAATLFCLAGSCEPTLKLNQPCDPGVGGCDGQLGLFCAAGGTCQQLPTAPAGASCVPSGMTPPPFCLDSICLGGTCISTVDLCEACSDAGPFCRPPGACVEGVCSLPIPATCRT